MGSLLNWTATCLDQCVGFEELIMVNSKSNQIYLNDFKEFGF